jgi:hypothetical protein
VNPSRLDCSEGSHFGWLLSTTALNSNPPNEQELLKICEFLLCNWQVLPACLPRLLAWAAPSGLAENHCQPVIDRAVSLRIIARLQLILTRRLTDLFQRECVPYVLLKGSAIRHLAYVEPDQRCGKDLDIAVPRKYIKKAQELAQTCGFIPSEWHQESKRFSLANPGLRAAVESQHYELGFLVRRQTVIDLDPADEASIRRDIPSQIMWHLTADDKLACYVSVDIHHGLSHEMPVEPLVENAWTYQYEKWCLRLPPIEWILLHLIYKLYWEGVHNYGKGGYQFADLIRLLPRINGKCFRRFVQLLEQFKLEAAGFYTLRRLESNFGIRLRADVMEFLAVAGRPSAALKPIYENDLGDMWPRIWGVR